MAVLDELLGVIPCTTSIAEVVGHELTSKDYCCQESTKCEVVDTEANDDWCQHCEQGRRRELAQRGSRADVDNRAVVRLFGAGHDATVSKLLAHFLYNDTGRATHSANRECREHERNRPTDEQTDEGLHICNVDLCFRCQEDEVTLEQFSCRIFQLEFTSDGFDVGSKECHSSNDR